MDQLAAMAPIYLLVAVALVSALASGASAQATQPRRRAQQDSCAPHEDQYAQTVPPFEMPPASAAPQRAAVESLLGQVAKTVVYGGASLVRLNTRLLCPLLARESEPDEREQPTLFVFNEPQERELAIKIRADEQLSEELLGRARFRPDQMSVLLVHGWLGGLANELWLSEARNVALQLRALANRTETPPGSFRPNVLVLDWSELARGSLFAATHNSHKVARTLGRLLGELARVAGLQPELMHCLGHSIGAHICGQAARAAFPAAGELRRFGRITGLDPGGFCYELAVRNETQFAGLRPSDALLVDAYYSNRSPFGNKYQVAHYNVRLNGGFLQRPCSVWRRPELATKYFRAALRFLLGSVGHNDVLTCDHYFATRFAHRALPASCSFVGYACDSYRSFVRGRCGQCASPAHCYTMDFEYQRPSPSSAHALEHIARHSSQQLGAQLGQPPGGVAYASRRVYYMQVGQDESAHCSATYRVRVLLDWSVSQAFRSDWLTLSFLSGEQDLELATLREGGRRKLSGSLGVHGPWEPLLERAQQPAELSGLDNRTLTGLFELLSGPSNAITGVIVSYNNDPSHFGGRRNLSPGLAAQLMANPIESVELDYLSSSDKRIRARYSRSFQRHQFVVRFRHLLNESATGAE